MRSLLVAYDLVGADDDSDNYKKLIKRLKEYPNWARVELSTWILKTDAKAKEVRDDLLGFMHSSDRLFVGALTGEAAWHKVRCKSEWLKENL
jgi:hypothetical protein